MRHTTVKAKDFWPSFIKLLRYMRPEYASFAFGIFFAILGTVFLLIGPQYISQITDVIFDSITDGVPMDTRRITTLGITALIVFFLSFLFTYIENKFMFVISEKVAKRMRAQLARKIDSLPLSVLDKTKTGDLMSRMTNDCETIANQCSDGLDLLITALGMFIGTIAMMLYTEWHLALWACLPAILGFAVLYLVTTRTQKFFKAQTRDLGRVNALVEEVYYGHDVVTTYNNRENSVRKFADINNHLSNTAFKARAITSITPQLMNFLGNLDYVIVCVVGSMMIVSGDITYGAIAAFIIYVRKFNLPITQLSEVIAMLQSVVSASERIFEVLEWEDMEEIPDNGDFEFREGRVEFRDVRFGYIPGTEVIHGLTLDVKPGSKVAIVGPTGAGKSTIVNLLMRFYETSSGDILIDGTPIRELSRRQIHDLFSMVLQDSWLFDGTIRDNVRFTKTDATQEQVEQACRDVGIHDFIMSLENGYDTVLSDVSGLSVGQRQQITIARAILKDAPMIILDEATSSVDTKTERHIQEAMNLMTADRTSFVIAHRLSTIVNSDVILVIRDGDIIEKGSHEQLIALNGFYKMLYDSQFENCD